MPAPAFQFYPRDFLADANVARMTAEEVGAYWLLISYCWLEGSLPNDETDLAMLARLAPARFKRAWERRISERFMLGDDNRLRHRRLEEERQKQEAYRSERSASGKRGAQSRWQHSSANSSAIGEPMAADASSSAICDLRSAEEEDLLAAGTGVREIPRRVPRREKAQPSDLGKRAAGYLLKSIRTHQPDFQCSDAKLLGWARDLDLLHRVDKREWPRIGAVITWCHRSPAGAFWRGNILSGRKLREQFDQLEIKMAEPPKANGSSGGRREYVPPAPDLSEQFARERAEMAEGREERLAALRKVQADLEAKRAAGGGS